MGDTGVASELMEPVTVAFPFAAAGVGQARRQMAGDLRAYGVAEEVVEDAQVVLSELMANAVRHARPLASGGLAASWQVNSQRVTLTVTDGGGATTPAPAKASLLSLGGRGLAIVEELTVEWGVSNGQDATTVYAVIAITV